MSDFYVIPTNIGEAKMANALALGTPLAITELAIGDGEGDGARGTPIPNPEATTLVSEQRRAPVNSFSVDPDNDNVLVAEQVIPETAGGWWIREMGLFDEDGDLIFVCNTPPTYKPQLSEGSGRTQVVRMASIVSNTAAVTLKVDPAVVLATREYVQELVAVHAEDFNDKINQRVAHLDSIATLRETDGASVGGQVRIFDSGSEQFFDAYWVADSEAPDDGVSVFQVAGTPIGRWIADPAQNRQLFFSDRPFISPIMGNKKHKGLTSQIFPTDEIKPIGRKSIIIWREGTKHAYDGSSVIKAADIYASGQTLTNIRTIYDESDIDARDFSGAVLSNGRIALMVSRRTGDASWTTPIYLYSDDSGDTWTSTVQSGLSSGLSMDEYLHPYPTSAGGADSGGYIGFAWVNPTRDRIKWFATTDFGNTWTEGDAVVGDGIQDLSEPRVVRLGDADRWVMFIRQNQASGLNSLASKSTDLKSWGGVLDTGQTLGRNCASVWYDQGKLFWTAFSRPYADPELSIDGFDDALLAQSLSADVAWDSDLSAWHGWRLIAHLYRPLGYLKIVKIDGELLGCFAQDESGSSVSIEYSALSIISNKSFLSDSSIQKGSTSITVGGLDFPANYIRFRDGKQEVWGEIEVPVSISQALGSLFITSSGNEVNVPFPLPFAEGTTPVVNVRTVSSGNRAMPSAASGGFTTEESFWLGFQAATSVSDSNIRFSFHAIGYWS